MFFRFGAALLIVVLVALTGTTLEKQNLELNRAISHQQYRMDELKDLIVRLQLEAERLGTPSRILGTLDRGELSLKRPTKPRRSEERQPQAMPGSWSGTQNRSVQRQ